MNKRKYRSYRAIWYEILLKCAKPQIMTRIVYGCNANSKTGKQHLEDLIRMGFLRHVGNKFETTLAGLKWTEIYKELELYEKI